jgi:hypothetical protein
MAVMVFFAVLAFSLQMRNAVDQRRRIALLGRFLRNYQIESLMETLIQGYLRAMGESDPERRTGIWLVMRQHEERLSGQLAQLHQEMRSDPGTAWRASTLPLSVPLAVRWLPRASFDLRDLIQIHARGVARGIANEDQRSARDRAYRLSAELLLLQHSCHWFCRSKVVASARMFARHQTHYRQLLAAVAPDTRSAYLGALSGR